MHEFIAKHYRTETLMSAGQVMAIGSAIRASAPGANVLIFGCGNDSHLWNSINYDGYTLFLEDHPGWMDKVQHRFPDIHIEMVSYGDRTVESSLPIDEEALSAHPEPACLIARTWDVIVIDGPQGHKPWSPGRSLPIYWSHKVAWPETQIFVDDYNRRLERAYSDHFLRPTRPWSVVIPRIVQLGKPTRATLLWLIGVASTLQEGSIAAQNQRSALAPRDRPPAA